VHTEKVSDLLQTDLSGLSASFLGAIGVAGSGIILKVVTILQLVRKFHLKVSRNLRQ